MNARQLEASVDAFLAVHPLAAPADGDATLAEELVACRLFATRGTTARVGSITLERSIGVGGMGRVYAGRDDGGRRVAVKFLRSAVGYTEGDEARRLRREARALARIDHPNVVKVFDVGHDESQGTYVVMQYVEGVTLRSWLGDARPPIETVVDALAQCAQGLHAAHESGIVHRDFKPDNVLVGRDGRVAIADFGLASTRPGQAHGGERWARIESTMSSARLGGTLAYMAPERMDGHAPDVGTDVFAFCLSAWELLSGRKPATATPPTEEVPVSNDLAHALLQGMIADPELRCSSMSPIVAAFARERRPRRRRWPLMLCTLAVGSVLLPLILFWLGHLPWSR